ncbi:hypothetical protein KC332_g17299 [Hortaea werneckii]|uniref:Uncharacterized protein n=1 Tax=Hortaea werneckii TaxID=91943 RepID=A0A3M7HC45_HORWE|nr:hypothetical protein KC358_g17505 [Hortaea werneckii]KAI6793610.1 hypothetical protein KC350_g17358 [Hortaea werneckii]KAI6898510.1 hypothetical protein KC348_g17422 [Hortaea werneckii]KAI6919178.1 hypothetical protein KC341_g17478 [Hortaea werneckii]KAI6952624.1 hypothetical protein KC321_g17453 [Hortaea werneckii]
MTEPLFRANKRRKVFRKRKDDGEEEKEQSDSEAVQQSNGEDHEINQRLRALRKPTVRKHGIGFTSSNAPRSEEHDENEDREMMPMHPERQQHMAQADRFVKPTGRIAVGEDKHMMSFVDSKLAEMRSAKQNAPTQPLVTLPEDLDAHPTIGSEQRADSDSDGVAESKSESITNKTQMKADSRRPARPRRPPAVRDEKDVARDSLVDQILGESTVPHYDRPAASKQPPPPEDDNVDRDAAAAEAFKKRYLASIGVKRKRKVAPPSGATRGATAISTHGPKLGGSRSQRQKMKAMERQEKGSEK